MKLLCNLLAASLISGVVANEAITPDKVEADIQERQLRDVLWNFNKIARDNGGNRAYGLPGYNASIDFVLERVQKRFGKHLDTTVQRFSHLFETTRKISITGPDGKQVYAVRSQYNTATPLPGGITANLIDTPVDDTRGSGCFEDQWQGIDATGKIALVKRGVCAISDKLKLAKAHGALAVVLYNQTPGKDITVATLGAENVGLLVPVATTTLEVGQDWKQRLAAGETVSVNVLVDSVVEDRDSWNIITETKEGDPNNVIMLGAHLDSVQAGPGINDDGSGSAGLLAVIESFKKYKGYKNKVRFAFWGAEESGLVGSLYYGSQLSSEEADKIRFYFNYDMIGSPVPYYAVYADNDADKTGGKILFDWLQAKGKPAYYGGFGSSSDYVAFLNLGIPSSGLFTGAGAPADPNYHQAGDDITNINWEAITLNTKAAGRAAAQLALSLDGVPARQTTSKNPRSKKAIARRFDKNFWAESARIVEKTHNCGGHGSSTV